MLSLTGLLPRLKKDKTENNRLIVDQSKKVTDEITAMMRSSTSS